MLKKKRNSRLSRVKHPSLKALKGVYLSYTSEKIPETNSIIFERETPNGVYLEEKGEEKSKG